MLTDQHATHFPPDRLVENRARLCSFALHRAGAFAADGVVTEVRWGDGGRRLARQAPDILLGDIRIAVVWDELKRPWFLCPRCQRRCRHLYFDEIACRTCCAGGLDYASRHVHRSTPGVHRIARWRRQLVGLGVDARPFEPLPMNSRSTRVRRLVAKIIAEENALIGHLGGVNRDLHRRARRRGMLPK
ncbi:hypothetical protein [Bradyrhizobium iriomotense]|uniref:hypothetical protein n=1 Tax=Bradyrhizobium iriomotense TaxID=441950 RepID=UPI0024E16D06|nr:hypothetical protein [Bradyrhizobium iriomotense]